MFYGAPGNSAARPSPGVSHPTELSAGLDIVEEIRNTLLTEFQLISGHQFRI